MIKILFIIAGILLILAAVSELSRALAIVDGSGQVAIWFKFAILIVIGGLLIYFGFTNKKQR